MTGIVAVDRRRSLPDAVVEQHMAACAHLPVYDTPGLKSGPVVICAAGPSLLDNIALIAGLQKSGIPICAVKGVSDVLIANGIIPDYAVFMDPQEHQERFLKTPHPDVLYLVCTQSHPDVFKRLQGFKVLTWHGQCREAAQAQQREASYIHAATTGIAAVQLMRSFGYSRQHMFGFDCSYRGEVGHVYDKPAKPTMRVKVGKREFTTTLAMLDQHNLLIGLMIECPDLAMTIYGDGALMESVRALRNVLATPYDYMMTTDEKPSDHFDAEAA